MEREVVNVNYATLLGLSDGQNVSWHIKHSSGAIVYDSEGRSEGKIEVTFTSIGAHTVVVYSDAEQTTSLATWSVQSRIVRRELRSLDDDELEAYFSALKAVYSHTQACAVHVPRAVLYLPVQGGGVGGAVVTSAAACADVTASPAPPPPPPPIPPGGGQIHTIDRRAKANLTRGVDACPQWLARSSERVPFGAPQRSVATSVK